MAKRHSVSFGDDEDVLTLAAVVAAELVTIPETTYLHTLNG